MKIYLIGRRSNLGGGILFSGFCDALFALDNTPFETVEVNVKSKEEMVSVSKNATSSDILIFFSRITHGLYFKGVKIYWAIFESTLIDPHRRQRYQDADLVWVPSDWGKNVLCEKGISAEKIDVVHEGVDSKQFHPFLRSARKKSTQFRFLSVGKYESRKSYDEIFSAFEETYANDHSVELIVKADFFIDAKNKKTQLEQRIKKTGLSNIKSISGLINRRQLFKLYSMSDVFVGPSKSEGWGLPLIEAAACGMPIISTLYSGHSEFLGEILPSVYCVDYQLSEIDDDEFYKYNNTSDGNSGEWAIPNTDSLKSALINCREEFDNLNRFAFESASIIRSRFSWEDSVNMALKSITNRGFIRDIVFLK